MSRPNPKDFYQRLIRKMPFLGWNSRTIACAELDRTKMRLTTLVGGMCPARWANGGGQQGQKKRTRSAPGSEDAHTHRPFANLVGRGRREGLELVGEQGSLETVLNPRGVLEVAVRLLEGGDGMVAAKRGLHFWED